MPYGYYGRKLACEQAIADGSVPHTIQRATQFHELLERGLRAAGRLPLAPLPLAWQVQPISAAEVAQRIVALLGEAPSGRAVDLGGPEVLTAKRVVDVWRARHPRPRTVANVHPPGRTATRRASSAPCTSLPGTSRGACCCLAMPPMPSFPFTARA